jgi:hypothetical protein
MMMKIVLQLLLLPIVVIAVPLMFGLAWVHEAIDERKVLRAQVRPQP